MGIDANLILESPVDFGSLLEPKPKHFSITLVGSSLHKKDILDALTPSHVTVDMLAPKAAPKEEDYITGKDLIIQKANVLYGAVEEEGNIQGPEEIWVANDINSAIGVAGGPFEYTMRKFTDIDKNLPHDIQQKLLIEHITDKFSRLDSDTIYTVRIEALSAWRIPKDTGLVVINERGYIQLPPGLIEKLRNPEFVKNYLDYCEAAQKSMREEGENPGARNLNAPWGIRWDDLLDFIGWEEQTETEPSKGQGVHLNVRSVPGQSDREGFDQHIRGFSAVAVKDAIPMVSDIFKHPQKLKKGMLYREFEP